MLTYKRTGSPLEPGEAGRGACPDVRLTDVLGPAFHGLARDVFRHGHTHYDIAGGRGSLKSSAVSLMTAALVMSRPDIHALVLRKVGNTLRDSVFAQYIWALGMLEAAPCWEVRHSPPELIYLPTGQKILFRGADDPMKLKSIKVPFGYIAVTHFEEKDQFAGREEIRSILQSTMRGGEIFWNFESYNPPRSRDHWANADALIDRPDRLRHHSTYLQAPRRWLGEPFFAEAEALRRRDEAAWRNEYLGEPTGTGANVFDKLEIRPIPQEELDRFDRVYQGVDFGWYPDAFAFVRAHYDAARETVFLMDEHYAHRESNQATGTWLLDRGYDDCPIVCDSAEPKSIADYRDMGLPARGAIKGPGSVSYGFKWLQSRTIVADPRRTPYALEELRRYEYARDGQGELVSGYPDKNDHAISALRYAFEPLYSRRTARA